MSLILLRLNWVTILYWTLKGGPRGTQRYRCHPRRGPGGDGQQSSKTPLRCSGFGKRSLSCIRTSLFFILLVGIKCLCYNVLKIFSVGALNMPYKNPREYSEYQKKWKARYSKLRYLLNKSIWNKFLEHSGLTRCFCCGTHTTELQFHHVDGRGNEGRWIADMKWGPVESAKGEIRKTVPVCAPCHRELHRGIIFCPAL